MEHASIYRIFRMLEMLGSNVDYTTPELTERLDVCERSTYRYIETLKLAGCTIIKKDKNIHKLVKIPSEGIKLEELVLISSEEAYLIHRMLRSIAGECPLVYNLELKLAAILLLQTKKHLLRAENSLCLLQKRRVSAFFPLTVNIRRFFSRFRAVPIKSR